MRWTTALASAALCLCALAHSPAAAAATDPTFLTCTFEGGRSILGLVVFKRLKKLRIWYGDGGGEEWTGVDYSKPEIVTSVEGGRSIVLSADFRSVTFNDQEGEEHSGGHCRVASKRGKPAYWFAPKLTQH